MRRRDVQSLLAAMATRPFVIISGLSGTGKTQLVRRMAAAISVRGLDWTSQALADLRLGGQGGALRSGWLFSSVDGHPDHLCMADLLDIEAQQEQPLACLRIAFQPVRPDWNDAKKIWGYYNPLSGRFYPTDALVVLLNAYREYLSDPESARPHFLLLDEMNLARVEYYLSDLLSLMEAGCREDPDDPQKIHLGELARVHPLETCVTSLGFRGVATPTKAVARREPEDLGATSMAAASESRATMSTSRPTSDDQLVPLWELEQDRWFYEPLVKAANVVKREPGGPPSSGPPRPTTLEQLFPIPPRIAFPPNLIIVGTVNVDETTHGFAPKVLDRAFVVDLRSVDHEAVFARDPRFPALRPLITQIHTILKPWELELGYRVVAEMLDYLDFCLGLPTREVEDDLILSKVLPRLTGSEERVAVPLRELMGLCLGGTEHEGNVLPDLEEIASAPEVGALLPTGAEPLYPDSARKLLTMARRLIATGFCSFF